MFSYGIAGAAVVEGLSAMYGGKNPPPPEAAILMTRMKQAQHFMVEDAVVEKLTDSRPHMDLTETYLPFNDVYVEVENPSLPVEKLGFFFHRGVGLVSPENLEAADSPRPELGGIMVVFHPDGNAQLIACFTLFEDGQQLMFVAGDDDPYAPPNLREVLESEFARALIAMDATTQGILTTYTPSKFRRTARKRKHKHKLLEYKLLRLDLAKLEQSLQVGQGHHASPRLHLRRGHWRVYKNGHRKWIKPMWVGDKEKGMVIKDYQLEMR